MSAGVMLAMSPWMTWPTFSSTVIFLSSAATLSSSAASLSNGHFGDGQISGCTAAGSAGLASATGAGSLAPSLQAVDRKGTSASAARYRVRTRDMEGDIEDSCFSARTAYALRRRN